MIGLDNEIISSICAVFEKYENIAEVILYGSRAKGNFKKGSDIDLTLIGDHECISLI
jgi:predicted nucleotidyltransferase